MIGRWSGDASAVQAARSTHVICDQPIAEAEQLGGQRPTKYPSNTEKENRNMSSNFNPCIDLDVNLVVVDDLVKTVEAQGRLLLNSIKSMIADGPGKSGTAELLDGIAVMLAVQADPYRDDPSLASYSDGSPVIDVEQISGFAAADPDIETQPADFGLPRHYVEAVCNLVGPLGFRVVVNPPPHRTFDKPVGLAALLRGDR